MICLFYLPLKSLFVSARGLEKTNNTLELESDISSGEDKTDQR